MKYTLTPTQYDLAEVRRVHPDFSDDQEYMCSAQSGLDPSHLERKTVLVDNHRAVVHLFAGEEYLRRVLTDLDSLGRNIGVSVDTSLAHQSSLVYMVGRAVLYTFSHSAL